MSWGLAFPALYPSSQNRFWPGAGDGMFFGELGYTAVKASAVDMFPRTEHVETVVLLSGPNTGAAL